MPSLLGESELWYDRLEGVHERGRKLLLAAILSRAGPAADALPTHDRRGQKSVASAT